MQIVRRKINLSDGWESGMKNVWIFQKKVSEAIGRVSARHFSKRW